MQSLGDKIKAKKIAVDQDIPVIKSSEKNLSNVKVAVAEAKS